MKTIIAFLFTAILFVQVLKGLALLTLYEKLCFLCDALAVSVYELREFRIKGKEKEK